LGLVKKKNVLDCPKNLLPKNITKIGKERTIKLTVKILIVFLAWL